LLKECRTLGGCATGSAKITAGYRLPAKHVIHAVGPVWNGGNRGEPDLLASCYGTALELAVQSGLTSIAYPAISTGIYRFPADLAARIAVGTVVSEISADPRGINRVVFCCFSQDSADHHANTFAELGLASPHVSQTSERSERPSGTPVILRKQRTGVPGLPGITPGSPGTRGRTHEVRPRDRRPIGQPNL
jgi:O-acetyl-ADP-ribose deacetylase (regulator of RNase III)